jgi:hypothetical protein
MFSNIASFMSATPRLHVLCQNSDTVGDELPTLWCPSQHQSAVCLSGADSSLTSSPLTGTWTPEVTETPTCSRSQQCDQTRGDRRPPTVPFNRLLSVGIARLSQMSTPHVSQLSNSTMLEVIARTQVVHLSVLSAHSSVRPKAIFADEYDSSWVPNYRLRHRIPCKLLTSIRRWHSTGERLHDTKTRRYHTSSQQCMPYWCIYSYVPSEPS